MRISNSRHEDIDAIFNLYDEAMAYQRQLGTVNWIGFERSLIAQEIAEERHFKIMENEGLACTFVITTSDPEIWQEANNDAAVYLHRIATNPLFRGKSYVKAIVAWAREYAAAHDKDYIRMDTTSGNERLNNYYFSCGFVDMGLVYIESTENLPAHYNNRNFILFEIKL